MGLYLRCYILLTVLVTVTECSECGYTGERTETPSSGEATYIRGGQSTSTEQHPWQVLLKARKSGYNAYCGATIVGRRWLLTAGHCVANSDVSSSVVYIATGISGWQKTLHWQSVHLHPAYTVASPVPRNDLALIETTSDIPDNQYSRPVCLPDSQKTYVWYWAIISGWGDTEGTQERLSPVLKFATVLVIPEWVCGQRSLHDFLCAFGFGSSPGNVCYGDSGGPMTITEDGRTTVIGIAWWTYPGCPLNYPFGYTYLGLYLDWIKTTIAA